MPKVKVTDLKIPNKFHMEQKLQGGRVQRNKKKYTRKAKHKQAWL